MEVESRIDHLVRAIMLEERAEHNGVRSLTKDVVFFFTFIFQVVILFVFFWQKRQNVRRYVLGESTEIDESEDNESENPAPAVANSTPPQADQIAAPSSGHNLVATDAVEKTPEQALEEEFVPIESALNELNAKIRGLEGTLRRRGGHNNTDSLKRRLRDAISHITVTLAQMSKIQQVANHDQRVAQLVVEQQELEQKKKVLEEVESDNVAEKVRLFGKPLRAAAFWSSRFILFIYWSGCGCTSNTTNFTRGSGTCLRPGREPGRGRRGSFPLQYNGCKLGLTNYFYSELLRLLCRNNCRCSVRKEVELTNAKWERKGLWALYLSVLPTLTPTKCHRNLMRPQPRCQSCLAQQPSPVIPPW
jgi:hypothetical protein